MQTLAILFDLDGTLTDSGEGIINCAQLALSRLGLPCRDREALRAFVGPPLRESFPKFGVPQDRVEEAVAVYRSRYNIVGKFENRLYPGIPALLARLSDFPLYVATSKPERTAREVLEKFRLDGYFSRICGADFEGRRETKEQVLACLLEQLAPGGRAVMVGDTVYDVTGAAKFSIPTVGVSWGYGDPAELTAAGAVAVADTPEALEALLRQYG